MFHNGELHHLTQLIFLETLYLSIDHFLISPSKSFLPNCRCFAFHISTRYAVHESSHEFKADLGLLPKWTNQSWECNPALWRGQDGSLQRAGLCRQCEGLGGRFHPRKTCSVGSYFYSRSIFGNCIVCILIYLGKLR